MDPKQEGQYDEAFLSVLADIKQIEPFLDHLFNFLYRRSDFYHIMRHDRDYKGFKPGQAEEMVKKYFRKYQRWARDAEELRAQQEQHQQQQQQQPPSPKDKKETPSPKKGSEVRIADLSPSDAAAFARDVVASQESARRSQSETYNGGATENYIWSQTMTDVDIKVPVPPGTKGRDLEVEIGLSRLRVAMKKEPPPPDGEGARVWPKVFIDGELCYKIKGVDSMWSLDGSTVQINLEKNDERMWKCAILGDEEIDLTKVDTSKHIHDFDMDTQTAFERVMYDHRQKMQGKPTIEQQKAYNVLKGAWDAEGSPFKGTPFDPTRVNIHTSSSSGYVPSVHDSS